MACKANQGRIDSVSEHGWPERTRDGISFQKEEQDGEEIAPLNNASHVSFRS